MAEDGVSFSQCDTGTTCAVPKHATDVVNKPASQYYELSNGEQPGPLQAELRPAGWLSLAFSCNDELRRPDPNRCFGERIGHAYSFGNHSLDHEVVALALIASSMTWPAAPIWAGTFLDYASSGDVGRAARI